MSLLSRGGGSCSRFCYLKQWIPCVWSTQPTDTFMGVGQGDASTEFRMSWKWDLPLNQESGLSVLGVRRVLWRGLSHRSCALPCHASSPGGAAASGQGCDGEGEREPKLLVPACTWWQALPAAKLVDCSWGLQCCRQCSVQRDVRLLWGLTTHVGLEAHGRFTQAWLNGKKCDF